MQVIIYLKFKIMKINIRKFKQNDKSEILKMMTEFYSSNAVSTNGSIEIFEKDFDECIKNSSYLEGYVFIENSSILGYAMLAKSFSTEFGKPCIWFEDLYLKPEYRGKGIVTKFIYHIKENYKNHVFKLEVEDYNEHALHIYKKCGFEKLPYSEMILKNY